MTPAAATWQVAIGGERATVAWDPPTGDDCHVTFVCAHGAGGQMNDRAIVAVTRALRDRGVGTVRFNFLYRERGSGRPDPMPKVIKCYDAVVASVRQELAPHALLIGGRSMGGRAASMLAADGVACDGLLLLAYPLHPPGHPEKLRVEHLPRITPPVLCVNGTRDPFCDPVVMKQSLAGLGPNWRMLWLEGADHSFHVLKSSGRTDQEVLDQVADAGRNWIDAVVGRSY
jgi:predicted alpha/beta-hydrolase family hydrolase